MSSLLHDLYNYGVKFDHIPTVPMTVKNIDFIIDIFENGDYNIVKYGKKENVPVLGLERRTRNIEAFELHDTFKYIFGEHKKLFWDKSINLLNEAGFKKEAKAVDLVSKKIKSPAFTKEPGGFFALRFAGESDLMVYKVVGLFSNESKKPDGICLLSGKPDAISRLHPQLRVKGFKDAGSLVSFNFESGSYKRLKSGDNFPVGESATKIYAEAFKVVSENAIRINETIALIIWSDSNNGNDQQIRNFLEGKECNLVDSTSNTHILFLYVVKGRYAVMSYDVLPDNIISKNISRYKQLATERMLNNSIKSNMFNLLGTYKGNMFDRKVTDKSVNAFTDIQIVFIKHILMGDKVPNKLVRIVHGKTKLKREMPYLRDLLAQDFVQYFIKDKVEERKLLNGWD